MVQAPVPPPPLAEEGWAEESHRGILTTSHRSFPSGSPAPSAPALPWDVGSTTHSTHIPYIDSGTIKERGVVAINLYLAPKETFPEPPPALSIQGVGFGAETLGFRCYCTPRGLRRGSWVSQWWGTGRGLMDEGIAGSEARELGRLRQSYWVVGAK